MNKYILAGIGTLAITSVVAPNLVSAYRGDPNVQGPNYTPERHEAVTTAFDNNDYDAWLEQMEGRGITQRITEENFARFAEAHRLMLAGDQEGADAIRAELGLGQHDGSGHGQGQGKGYGRNRNQ